MDSEDSDRITNLVGAFVLSVSNEMVTAVDATQHGACKGSANAALILVANNPGHTIEWLSQMLRITNSGCTRLVARLVSDGLVSRDPGLDARSVSLSLSRAGAAFVHELREARMKRLQEIVAPLSSGEIAQLGRLIGKLLLKLPQSELHAYHICRYCDFIACGPDCPVERAVAELAVA